VALRDNRGIARAKAHSKTEIRAWGRQGGRPGKLDLKAHDRLRKLLASGKSQTGCASILGVVTHAKAAYNYANPKKGENTSWTRSSQIH
jgi:hypothetical protein